jgi:hypothetical protein
VQLIPAANGWDARTAQKDRAHLPAIRDALGLGWGDMLFFDDEDGNIQKVGVAISGYQTSILMQSSYQGGVSAQRQWAGLK